MNKFAKIALGALMLAGVGTTASAALSTPAEARVSVGFNFGYPGYYGGYGPSYYGPGYYDPYYDPYYERPYYRRAYYGPPRGYYGRPYGYYRGGYGYRGYRGGYRGGYGRHWR